MPHRILVAGSRLKKWFEGNLYSITHTTPYPIATPCKFILR